MFHVPLKTLALMLGLCLLGLSLSQARCAPSPSPTPQSVRVRCAAISASLGNCIKVKRELLGRSAEGGNIIGYRMGRSFRKMTATFYGETGNAAEDYYFWQGSLFYVTRRVTKYRQPLGVHVENLPEGAAANVMRERFTLDRGRLVRWISENHRPQAVNPKAAREQARHLGRDVREYLTLLRSPDRPVD